MGKIHSSHGKLGGGSNTSPSSLIDTFTTHYLVMEKKGTWLLIKTKILVDGFNSETSTVYQFCRCKWHNCPCLETANDRYYRTMAFENQIRGLGYNVVSVWECSHPELSTKQLNREFVLYLYNIIIYDFEAALVKKNLSVTSDLMINSSHIPISVVISNSVTQEPIFLHSRDPEQLIEKFVSELVRW